MFRTPAALYLRRATLALGQLALPFVVVAILWEGFAIFGPFPPRLFPRIETIASALVRLVVTGILPLHALETLLRLAAGFLLGSVVGVTMGMLMGRYRWAEDLLVPVVSVGNPIPGLAYAPLFVLWFGLGNLPAVLLVGFSATFPVVVNTWTGVKAVKSIWIRAAETMGAGGGELFRKVVLPGSLPFVIAGLRQAFARSWIAVVGGEMIAATSWGLGWVIFDSKEFLRTDVMLSTLVVIGILGLGFERLVFQVVERRTVGRWGMVRTAGT